MTHPANLERNPDTCVRTRARFEGWARPRRSILALAVVAVLGLGALAGCSDDDSGDDSGSGSTVDEARAAVVEEANTICRASKERTAAIPTGTLVVPDPSTDAEQAATDEWAQATAAELNTTVDELAALEAEGDAAAQRDALVQVYRDAAAQLEDDGGAVLGDANYLSDDELHSYGFTDCVAPEKDTSASSTTSTTEAADSGSEDASTTTEG